MLLIWPTFHKWQALTIFSLFAFVMVLPVFEMPKSVFLWLFIVLSGISIWRHKDQFYWQMDDWLLFVWMLSGYVVAFFAGLHHKEWWGATGVLTLALFFLVVKHIRLSDRLKWVISLLVLLSTLLGTLEGLWQMFGTKQNKALELHSVGHVNHSAIYLVLDFTLALAMTMTLKKSVSFVAKVFVILCLLLTAGCIFLSNSRASAFTVVVVAMTFGFVWLKRSKWPLLVVSLSAAAVFGGLYFENASVVQKHINKTAKTEFLGERGRIWNSSLLAWRHFPWFGIGIRNYGQATEKLQTEWLAEENKKFEKGQYLPFSHAHNFYLSTLAEQGMFGFSIVMLLIGRIGYLLHKHRPKLTDTNDYWCRWLAALGAVEVVLVNGLFNTTLHHEHGLLALLLIGLWWSDLSQRAQA